MRRSTIFAVLALASCTRDPDSAPLDRLRLPTGMAIAPGGRWLFVTNGNWDGEHANSSLVALRLDALDLGLADPKPAGATLDADQPCRTHADGLRIECDPTLLIDASQGVRLPSGAGNIAIDRPSGDPGPLRLLIPSRIAPALSWVDVEGFGPGESLELGCGESDGRACDRSFRVGLDEDPSRLTLDEQGFRFGYLPHLLGGRMTMIGLDGDQGPHIVDVEQGFFREDGLFDSGLAGGFSVVQRACSVIDANAPTSSLECTRPFFFASQRYWWGVREFQVADGLDVLISGRERTVLGPNLESAEPKPLMGGLAFEDPERGDRLLVVHTTPPALSRVDTSLDEDGDPWVEVLDTVGLCGNPNVLLLHQPASGPQLAFVSCFGADSVAAVDLGVFAVVATIEVGDGPNELLIDPDREWLLVANTAESSISLIELSLASAEYLTEFARLGLSPESE